MNELLQLRNPVTCPCESTNWDYWDGVLLGSLTRVSISLKARKNAYGSPPSLHPSEEPHLTYATPSLME